MQCSEAGKCPLLGGDESSPKSTPGWEVVGAVGDDVDEGAWQEM